MKRAPLTIALTLPLTVALAACESEPETPPAITEAIPLDAGDTAPELPAVDAVGGDTLDTDAADQGVRDGAAASGETSSTMESGSNPPDMTTPPPGHKLQPAG